MSIRAAGAGRLALAALCTLGACSTTKLEEQIIRYPEAAGVAALPKDCPVATLEQGQPLPSGCCAVGEVFVGDTGFSYDCQRDRVLKHMQTQACALGGNTLVTWPVQDSDSNCQQLRGRVLRCTTADAEHTP
ncbi:MAG: hypothetical protein SF182_11920 [Deltaproteobacteria bacterium]|nr:hypothetical protein [Deltaproteobacteria bacterium]